ncbi:hypothetical protein [Dialister hominis]
MDESRHCRSSNGFSTHIRRMRRAGAKSAGSDAGKIKIGVVQIVQHGSLD